LHRANFKAGHFEKAAELLKHCQTFTLKEQARIDRNADKVSPYPCAEVIFQQVFLAAGDFTTLNRFILADLDDEDLSHGAIQEDMAMDYEGYPEFKQEDSLNFLVKSGHDNHLKHSWMTKFEGKLLTTKSKNATNLAHNCALALRDEEWAKALSMAREGMKKFPEQRIFLAQAGVSSAMLKEHKTSISLLKQSLEVPVPGELHDSGQSWKTNLFADHQSIKDWKKQDEIGYLSQLFTILAIADQLIIKSTKTADGNLHYQKTEATQFMTESELQLLGNTLSQVRSELKKITEESDSLTSGAMAHLLISDVDSTLSRDEKAGQYFGKYLNEDPKMQVILSLYKNFGKYYGY
jgi:hypothetical protein